MKRKPPKKRSAEALSLRNFPAKVIQDKRMKRQKKFTKKDVDQ